MAGRHGTAKKRPFRQGPPPKRAILLCCEGKTEWMYFSAIKRELKDILPIEILPPLSDGRKPSRVVEDAMERRSEGAYAETWCVFDRDDHPDFVKAVQTALGNGLRVAYSNECFELWLLLHFEKPSQGTPRVRYIERLRHHLQREYEKSLTEIHHLVSPRQEEAVRRAKELFKDNEDPKAWAGNNPSTTIHLLLQKIEENQQ